MIGGSVNQRYKTTMCRHWETTGNCTMGARCHFAHGKEDMRSANDPIPAANLMNDPKLVQNSMYPQASSMMMPGSNYKTVKCKYFEQGTCKYAENCSFAHGDEDMRNMQENAGAGMPSAMMMNSFNSPMNNYYMNELNYKIIYSQLGYIIQNLSEIKRDDKILMSKLKTAEELLTANNIEACAKFLSEIIYDNNATKEDKEKYQKIIEVTQAMAQTISQQYKMYSQGYDYSQMGGMAGGKIGNYNI